VLCRLCDLGGELNIAMYVTRDALQRKAPAFRDRAEEVRVAGEGMHRECIMAARLTMLASPGLMRAWRATLKAHMLWTMRSGMPVVLS
jgi:hypothetical protein